MALSHLRVVELASSVAAAYCGRQFAAWGAEVATLESRAGSPLRRRGPLLRRDGGEPWSALWAYVGANKRSVRTPESIDELLALLARADVFITDEVEPLGLPLETLRRR